jgi:hypothetical protein
MGEAGNDRRIWQEARMVASPASADKPQQGNCLRTIETRRVSQTAEGLLCSISSRWIAAEFLRRGSDQD